MFYISHRQSVHYAYYAVNGNVLFMNIIKNLKITASQLVSCAARSFLGSVKSLYIYIWPFVLQETPYESMILNKLYPIDKIKVGRAFLFLGEDFVFHDTADENHGYK